MPSQRSRENLFSALCAGVFSAFLFFIALQSESDGILLIFLPCFPLLLCGLAFGAKQSGLACAVATLMVTLLTGPGGSMFFVGFAALPAYFFVQKSLMWRVQGSGAQPERAWYPVLRLLSELTIIAAASFMLMALANASQGGLKSLVPASLSDSFKGTDPDFAASVQQFIGPLSFALFASLGWLWIGIFYGFAVLANKLLKTKSRNIRPSLAIEPSGIPLWLLVLAVLSGGLSVVAKVLIAIRPK